MFIDEQSDTDDSSVDLGVKIFDLRPDDEYFSHCYDDYCAAWLEGE